MEKETERLVQSNEGSGQRTAEAEVELPTDTELAAATDTAEIQSPVEGLRDETPSGQAVEPDSPQDESIPPELRPDADGNPPQITDRLLRKLRSKYFTVRHPVLMECGHKLDMINQPGNNCESCWWNFFNSHGQLVEVADQFFRTHGKRAMEGMRGRKFVKNFCRFMATVYHFKQEEEARLAKANEEQIDVLEGSSESTVPVEVQQAAKDSTPTLSSGLHNV
jgi:hypothetical protein